MNLIPAWKTDRVVLVLPSVFMEYYNDNLTELELFYADFLMEIAKYDQVTCLVPDQVHAEKMARLTQLDLSNFGLAMIEDIWIRDFAPIQSEEGYLKFTYNPSYNSQFFNQWVDQSFIAYFNTIKNQSINLTFLDLKMAGCNFIYNGQDTAITTEKLYRRNPNKTPTEINQVLQETLGIERLVVVPEEITKAIGNLDSMVRWIDSNRIIVNQYPKERWYLSSFIHKLHHCLKENLPHIEPLKILCFPSRTQPGNGLISDGNYLQFLRTKNRVYIPIYHRPEETKIKAIYTNIFGKNISFIDARVIAKYGGGLNCMTWSYLSQSKWSQGLNKRDELDRTSA